MSKGFREPDFAQVVTDRVTTDTIHRILVEDAEHAEHARELFSRGGYGICEDCSRKIAPERLEALPDATRCISCQSSWEQTNPR